MAEHKRFSYGSPDELKDGIDALGLDIPLSGDVGILRRPLNINGRMVPNRLAIHPMEGCDGTRDGKPDVLTLRRYDRFARGGAGLIWFEATAVMNEGRANPRQLHICRANADDFKRMLEMMYTAAEDEMGKGFRPYTVLQLTHSGRYSKPDGTAAPIIAARNIYLDRNMPDDHPVVTDGHLEEIEDKFAEAAALAREIGFDAVDIKSCHRYLNNELLSAFTREGRYGGNFENRTRFLMNIIRRVKADAGDSMDVTLRLNVYDAIPYPYGWGVDRDDFHVPDLSEPLKLAGLLRDEGVKLINVTFGNPYYNPHVGRPFDKGPYLPPQHPLEGTARMLGLARIMQNTYPDMAVIATGFTWLREYAANAAAGGMAYGWFSIAGFGRQAFAYPDFARDIIRNGAMKREKCCVTCSKCTDIMRNGGPAGCVPKDTAVYGPVYKQYVKDATLSGAKPAAEHV